MRSVYANPEKFYVPVRRLGDQLTAASSNPLAHVAASFGRAAFRIAAYSSAVSRTPSSAPRT